LEKPPPVFVREATGLVREVSSFSVFTYGTTVMGYQFTLYYILSLAPLVGGNLAFGFLIMAVAMLSNILVYYAFTVIMPRSGGDYVFVSRFLHPSVGFVGNISYSVFLLLFTAISGVTIETVTLAPLFGYLGVVYNSSALINLATTITTPLWIFIIGLIYILVPSYFAIRSMKFYLRAQNWTFLLTLIGALAIIAILAPMSQPTFAADFNAFATQYMGKSADYYQSVINSAGTSGWTLPSTSSLWGGVLFYPIIVVGGLYGIFGAQIAGEIRRPQRSYLLGTIAGGAFYLIFMAITILLYYNAMGFNFLSAIDFLLYNNPSQVPLPAIPYGDLLVAIASNPAAATLIVVTGFIGGIIYVPSSYLFMSRGLFAYSFDRILPEWFAKVSDRTHGPVNAVLASTAITTILFIVVNIPQSASYAFLFSSVAGVANVIFPAFILGVVAVVVYARKPQLYDSFPIKGWKLLLVGLSEMFFTALLVYLYLTNSVYGANTPIGLELIIGCWIIFVLIYAFARLRRGDMLKLAFQQIPPE